MQCKNCGSHYRMRDLACPYCGTENALGKIWLKQRTDAEIAYENERIAAGKRWSPFVYNRAVSRVIVVEIVLFILLMLLTFAFFGGTRTFYSLINSKKKSELIQEMNILIEEGKYEEVQYYWQEYFDYEDGRNPDLKKISQIADLIHTHNEYLNSKMEFLDLSLEKKQDDDFRLSYTLSTGFRVYNFTPDYGEELDPALQGLLDDYRDEVHAFMVGLLKLTEDEFNEIMSLDYYPYSDDEWEQIVRDRNGW